MKTLQKPSADFAKHPAGTACPLELLECVLHQAGRVMIAYLDGKCGACGFASIANFNGNWYGETHQESNSEGYAIAHIVASFMGKRYEKGDRSYMKSEPPTTEEMVDRWPNTCVPEPKLVEELRTKLWEHRSQFDSIADVLIHENWLDGVEVLTIMVDYDARD